MANDLDHILNHRDLKKSRRRWRWIAIAAIAALAIGAIVSLLGEGPAGPHVARVNISGLITGDDRQLELIDALRKDNSVKAILLRIDSPGGTTAGSEALYETLRKAGKEKPVVAVMDTVAASGGYITALAADHIVARGNSITGSIGVIFSYPEVSELLGKVGVKMEELKSGALKAEPSPYKPASDEAKRVAMEMVMDGFAWFKGLVAERRKLDPARVDVLADGRVYTGRQAIKEKLIDEIGGEDEAMRWLETERKLPKDTPIITRKPPKPVAEQWLGASLADPLLRLLGLERMRALAESSKLDGLLVLWHPQL